MKALSNNQLLTRLKESVKNEKQANAEVITFLAESESRRAYLEWGFGSLFDFIQNGLGYDASSAARRMHAARATLKVPELSHKIKSGEVSLGLVQKVEQFQYHEGRERQKRFTKNETRQLYQQVQHMSISEAENRLASLATSKKFLAPSKETNRAIKEGRRVVSFTIGEEHQDLLKAAKSALSHIRPDACLEEIYREALQFYVQHKDKTRSLGSKSPDTVIRSRRTNQRINLQSSPRTRNIPAQERKRLWSSYDNKGCAFRNQTTGKRCGSKHRLQQDHIQPYSKGGSHSAQNLQILCQAHNLMRARQMGPPLSGKEQGEKRS